MRQARLAEAVEVLAGCFADGEFTYAGEHYRIEGYDACPSRCSVRTRRSSSAAADGARSSLAARQAQTVGLAPRLLRSALDGGPVADPRSVTFAGTAEKIGWVRAAAGDRFEEHRAQRLPVDVPGDGDRRTRHRTWRSSPAWPRGPSGTRRRRDAGRQPARVHRVGGGALAEKLLRCREELGISSVMVGQVGELDAWWSRLAGT